MCQLILPEPVAALVTTLGAFVDARQVDLLTPLFQGILFAHGRRTATSWFRAGDFADDLRRGYHLLGSLGRDTMNHCAAVFFSRLRRDLHPRSASVLRPRP